MSSDTALLVIDMQIGLVDELPAGDAAPLLARAGSVIAKARAAHIPVIYVQHSAADERDSIHPGKSGWAIHPAIAPLLGETVVHKRHPDAFQETDLQTQLEQRGIRKLVIMGIQTEMCVDSTTRRAYSLDYTNTLVSDCHGTFDSPALTAHQIIAHHNATLGSQFAELKEADALTFDTAVARL